MSAYLSYVKAFGRDLRKVAVWEPGANVQLGDYGAIRRQGWEKLGNIWDRIPDAGSELRAYQTSHLDLMSLGSAETITANAGIDYSGVAGALSTSIRFNEGHSVFVRAHDCETVSLKRVQDIAEKLAQSKVKVWEKNWTFVNEVCSAKRFLVLVSVFGGGQVRVTAKTSELLEAFNAGRLTSDSGIQITGPGLLQFLGRSGPIHISLTKVSGSWWLNPSKGPTAGRVEFAEGAESKDDEVYVEDVDAHDFLNTLLASGAEE